MTDLEAERDRGQRAAAILRDPIVKEAFDEIRESYVSAWEQSSASDTDEREQAYYLLKALQSFRGQFESAVQTGKMASQQLDGLHK